MEEQNDDVSLEFVVPPFSLCGHALVVRSSDAVQAVNLSCPKKYMSTNVSVYILIANHCTST